MGWLKITGKIIGEICEGLNYAFKKMGYDQEEIRKEYKKRVMEDMEKMIKETSKK